MKRGRKEMVEEKGREGDREKNGLDRRESIKSFGEGLRREKDGRGQGDEREEERERKKKRGREDREGEKRFG